MERSWAFLARLKLLSMCRTDGSDDCDIVGTVSLSVVRLLAFHFRMERSGIERSDGMDGDRRLIQCRNWLDRRMDGTAFGFPRSA